MTDRFSPAEIAVILSMSQVLGLVKFFQKGKIGWAQVRNLNVQCMWQEIV
jgi:hypothetical protein